MARVHYAQFRHLAIENAGRRPTLAELMAIERLLGAELPASFREFLCVANGGTLDYVLDVPFGDGNVEQLSFGDLYSAEDIDEYGTLVGEIGAARKTMDLPDRVLPFAGDGGGSAVYLDLTQEGSGRVVAFVRGLPECYGLRIESAYIELAASFDAYVDLLRIDRLDALASLASDVRELSHVEAFEEWLDIGLPRWREDVELERAVRDARRRVASE